MLQKFTNAYDTEVNFVEDSYQKLNAPQDLETTKVRKIYASTY